MSIPQQVTKTHATGNDFVVYADPDGRFEPTPDEVRFLPAVGASSDIGHWQNSGVDPVTGVKLLKGRFFSIHAIDASGPKAGNKDVALGSGVIDLVTIMNELKKNEKGTVYITVEDEWQHDDLESAVAASARWFNAWKRGELDAFDVTIPGTPGSARGTYVDMGNPHVVAVLEDGKATLPAVEDLDLVTKPVVAPVLKISPVRFRVSFPPEGRKADAMKPSARQW